MKALSLHQPWASLVASGRKTIETRSWPTRHRGPLAIHAAAKPPDVWIGTGYSAGTRLPLGAVLAVARLVDCIPVEDAVMGCTELEVQLGDFTPGRWAWLLADVEVLPMPIPARGRQQIWNWDPPA